MRLQTRIVRLETIETLFPDGSAQTATFTYVWKNATRLRSLFFLPRSSAVTDANIARYAFQLQDQTGWYFSTTTRAPAFVDALAVMGKGRRWLPIAKDVASGDKWTIAIKQLNGAIGATPQMFFEVEDVTRPLAPEEA